MNLGDEKFQADLRQFDRRLRGQEVVDLRRVLATPEGRHLYTRIVYEMCNLEGLSFEATIKDGVCAARHDARNEGMRLIGRCLVEEATQHCSELWVAAKQERDARIVAAAVAREEAEHKVKAEREKELENG